MSQDMGKDVTGKKRRLQMSCKYHWRIQRGAAEGCNLPQAPGLRGWAVFWPSQAGEVWGEAKTQARPLTWAPGGGCTPLQPPSGSSPGLSKYS